MRTPTIREESSFPLLCLLFLTLFLASLLGGPIDGGAEPSERGISDVRGDGGTATSAQQRGRSLGSDCREAIWRIPSVYKGQFFTWEGLRIFVYSSPSLAASFIEEREVSDWCRENRIGEDTVADSALDLIGGKLYPALWAPMYALARGIRNDRLADLSVDMATFSTAIFPEITALRYIGDRPQPNGENGYMFGLDARSSFPSGHTAAAIGVARLADYHYGHWVGVPLYLLAAAIGYQRLGAGEHYLADVVGGAIQGFSVADAIVRERRRQRESGESGKEVSVLPMVGGRDRALGVTISLSIP